MYPVVQLVDKLGGDNHFKSRAVIQKRHSHVRAPPLEVGQGSMKSERDGILWNYLWTYLLNMQIGEFPR